MRQAHDNIQVIVIKTPYRVSAKGNEHRRHGAEEECPAGWSLHEDTAFGLGETSISETLGWRQSHVKCRKLLE